MKVIRPINQWIEEKVFSWEKWFFEWIHSFAKTVWGGIRSRVWEACWWKNSREWKQGSHAGFQEMNPLNSSTSWWKDGLWTNPLNDTNNFWEIDAKQMNEKDIWPTINITQFKEISWIIKPEIVTPYQVMYYNLEWKWYQAVPKWTHIEYSGKTIYSLYDENTKKYQAYARVKTFTKAIGTTWRDFESVPEWFIRTPWFDGMTNKTDKETIDVSHEKNGKIVSSIPRIWIHGEEIPKEVWNWVLVNYFWKNIIPKIQANIANIDQIIAKNRTQITQEALTKKIPLTQTSWYKFHVDNLQKKKTYERASQEIRSFTMNGQEVVGPTVSSIIESLDKNGILRWQLIPQASFVLKKHKEKQRLARIKWHKA